MQLKYKYFISLMIGFLCWGTLMAQEITIRGVVTDRRNDKPISYAAIHIAGTTQGTMTDDNGEFTLQSTRGKKLIISCLGYTNDTTSTNTLHPTFNIFRLRSQDYALDEVVIKPKKEKYKKKGNPAVAFVKNMIANRSKGDPKEKPYYEYERYEKLTYGLNNFDSIQQQKWLYRKFNFLQEYVDTSEISNLPILTVSTKELLEKNALRQHPQAHKRTITAFKHNGLDEMLPEESLNDLFAEAFKELDLYDNNISLFFNRFVSPLSSMGPNFYKYYLLDTLQIDNKPYVDLGFVPFISESFGFTGHLYVALDSTFFVKKAVLNIPADINLNFVDKMSITQHFERLPDGTRLLIKDDIAVEFKIYKGTRGIYARRINSYQNHRFDPPEDLAIFDREQDTYTLDEAKYRDATYWEENRHFEISKKENAVDQLLVRLREVPFFFYTEKLVSMIVGGYIPTHINPDSSKFDIGPINTLISGNSFEGARFRLGGLTTPVLNDRVFGSGYVAYGTKDKTVKYKGQFEYSFIDKKTHANEFPIHSIRASYLYDIDQLGQQYEFTNKDNIVLSLKRKSDNKNTYLRKAEVSYQREHYNGFSYLMALRNKIEYATRFVQFKTIDAGGVVRSIPNYMMTEAEVKLRYAPNEKFYQMRSRRIPITPNIPVFHVSHLTAKKGWLGSDYTLNRTDIGFEKRFWFSAYGYVDSYIKAAKVWDKVPFPMLVLPNANLSYIIQPQSYMLMDPLEFINDEALSWDMTYFLNGWIFNRVPLLKILQWREVLAFRGVYGNLSKKNNPIHSSGLFVFPEGSGVMGRKPYMEMAVGIENIVKLLRIDYVWRLTYRNQPHRDVRGIRISMHVTF